MRSLTRLAIALLGAVLLLQPGLAAGVNAELPRVSLDTTYVPPAGSVINVPAGGDFQAALNVAGPGDVIELQAGATFTGNFTLPSQAGTGWIHIRSSALGSLPPPGSRVAPSHASLMPRIVSPNSSAALTAASGAHHYRVIGVEITGTLADTGTTQFGLITLDSGTDFVFDRCYIHGTPTGNYKRGIQLNSARTAVIDSYLSDFHSTAVDAQAIISWNSPGPVKLVNNYLEASGENVIFGGADPSVVDLVPSDIEIRHNYFVKPLAWRVGDPSYAGIHWIVKNLLELKNARRVLIDGNLFENDWLDAQGGTALVLTVRNQDGTAPWSTVEDVTITNNIIQHVGQSIGMHGQDDIHPSQQSARFLIRNNLLLDNTSVTWGGRGWLFNDNGGITDLMIDHNTGFMDQAIMMAAPTGTNTRFVYTNNLTPLGVYGFSGTGTNQGIDTLNTYFPGAVFARNVLAGGNPALYPADNLFPLSLNEVAFVDVPGGNYRLSSLSPYKNAGTDGKDIGVDVDALQAATAGVRTGGNNQPPPGGGTLKVFITSPAADATVSGIVWSDVWVEGASGTANVFALSINGSTLASETSSGNHVTLAWNSATVANGAQTLVASVTDATGNTGSASRGFTIQNAGSTLTASFTSPAAGATVSGTTAVGMAASGASGPPITFTLAVDGTQVFTSSGTAATASYAWLTTGVADGTRTLTLTVKDGAGRTATSTRSVTVSNSTGGTLKVSITSPAAGATVSGTVWTDVWVEGASGTANVFTLSINGSTLASETSGGNHVTLAWNSATVANGAQTLVASVKDATGKTGSDSRGFTIQNADSALTASFTSPAAGATVSGTTAVGMAASGASGPPITFTLAVDGTQVFTGSGTAATASYAWPTTGVADGTRTLTLTVRDGSGRSATATRTVTVSNSTPPPPPPTGTLRVIFTSPAAGATVSGTVWVDIWVEGASGTSNVFTLSVGGLTVASQTTSGVHVTLAWDTRSVANGPQTMTATVRDATENTGSATRAVTVGN